MWLFCSQLSPVLYVRPRWTKSRFPPGFSRWHLCIIWDLTSKITGPWGCYVQLTKTPSSIISLNYVVSHPSRQLKIPSVAFPSLTSVFRQHIFSLVLINKSSFCFRTSQIPLERWFPSPGLSPWYTPALGSAPTLKTTPNHQHLVIPSHIIPLGCWALSLHRVWPAVPLPSSVCHFTRTSGFSLKFPLCSRADLWKELSGMSLPSLNSS